MNKRQQHYSGGLAEVVDKPTLLTYSFLRDWFTTNGSLGLAMDILGLPWVESDTPILELSDDEMMVNLKQEEASFYKQTIFRYREQLQIDDEPTLEFDKSKVFSILSILNTLRILWVQSIWLADPEATLKKAYEYANSIPKINTSMKSIKQIDKFMKNEVWPRVIVVDMLSEFYFHVVYRDFGDKHPNVYSYINSQASDRDWMISSVTDMEKVKDDEMSFDEYINLYGIRADNDYELTEPRWYEIPKLINKRINSSNDQMRRKQTSKVSDGVGSNKLVLMAIEMQVLRSQVRKRALYNINQLRKVLLNKSGGKKIPTNVSKEDYFHPERLVDLPKRKKRQSKTLVKKRQSKNSIKVFSGFGRSISSGSAVGSVVVVKKIDTKIPKDTIGIFPNASPTYAILYPKCKGMIFLKGGITSHGAIVAREFGIPAIVDAKAKNIDSKKMVKIDGDTGEWEIV